MTRTGDFSDVVVEDADGRRIPWPQVSRLDQDELRDLMSEVVNKLYTFLVKIDDAQFQALRDHLRPSTWDWDKPRLDDALMEQIEIFGSALSRPEDWNPPSPGSTEH